MSTFTDSRTLLNRALVADGVASGGLGALMLLAANPLGELLGLQASLLRIVGFSLLPFAALLVFLAMRATLSRPLVWAIVGYNLLWAIDSLLLLASGWVEPTTLGYVFTAGQALAVVAFAALEYVGLQRWGQVPASA